MAGGEASVTKIGIAERRAMALELRKAGGSYRQIAETLLGEEGIPKGYSPQLAHKDVTDELIRLREQSAETAVQVLDLELARLDAMTAAIWPQAEKGDQFAIDRVLKIQDRRAKYLGLDAAGDMKPGDVDAAIERELARLAAARQGGVPEGPPEADGGVAGTSDFATGAG